MSRDEQKVTHLHYHYHYSLPYSLPTPHPLAHARPLSKSQLLPTRNHAEKGESKRLDEGEGSEEELVGMERERSFKKLKRSDCWSTERGSRVEDKRSIQSQAPEIKWFTAQEEHASTNEDVADSLSHHFQHVKLPSQLGLSSQFEKGVIAKYQSELAWYRKEVERLRRVQEECIFLRKSYLEHFQVCQRRNTCNKGGS